VLPALPEKETGSPLREHLVLHTNGNGPLGLHMGPWMLITKDRNNTKQPELYNLADDLAETSDLAAKHPKKVKELAETLKKLQDNGRSRL
jgi:hypothetical protein